MTCREARSAILEVVRGLASEADRLLLEEHLGGCPACRAERGQWALMERVRDQPVRHLTPAARARVLQKIIADAPRASVALPAPSRLATRRWAPVAGGLAAAAALALVLSLAASRRAERPVVVLGDGGGRHPYGHVIDGRHPGSVQVPGAQLWYPAEASLTVASARRVDVARLGHGELEVEVKPGGPGRFRVYGPRFIVEVIGTRFAVSEHAMRTLHGTVRVLGLDERELAVVRAGERWEEPATPVATPVGVAAPAPVIPVVAPPIAAPPASPVAAAPAPQRGARSAVRTPRVAPPAPMTPAAPAPRATAVELLAQARAALVAGDFDACRARIGEVRLASPTLAQRGKADLMAADLLRNEGKRDAAVRAYREVAQRWTGSSEGELASYFLGELLAEGRSEAAARAALLDYLARYPSGRFVDDARQRLRDLRAEP